MSSSRFFVPPPLSAAAGGGSRARIPHTGARPPGGYATPMEGSSNAAAAAAASSSAAPPAAAAWVPARPLPPAALNPFLGRTFVLDYSVRHDVCVQQLVALEAIVGTEVREGVYALVVEDPSGSTVEAEAPKRRSDPLASFRAAMAADASASAMAATSSKQPQPQLRQREKEFGSSNQLIQSKSNRMLAAATAAAASSSTSSQSAHAGPSPNSTNSGLNSGSASLESRPAQAKRLGIPIWRRSELISRLNEIFSVTRSTRSDLDGANPCEQPRIICEDIEGRYRPTWKAFETITPLLSSAAAFLECFS